DVPELGNFDAVPGRGSQLLRQHDPATDRAVAAASAGRAGAAGERAGPPGPGRHAADDQRRGQSKRPGRREQLYPAWRGANAVRQRPEAGQASGGNRGSEWPVPGRSARRRLVRLPRRRRWQGRLSQPTDREAEREPESDGGQQVRIVKRTFRRDPSLRGERFSQALPSKTRVAAEPFAPYPSNLLQILLHVLQHFLRVRLRAHLEEDLLDRPVFVDHISMPIGKAALAQRSERFRQRLLAI